MNIEDAKLPDNVNKLFLEFKQNGEYVVKFVEEMFPKTLFGAKCFYRTRNSSGYLDDGNTPTPATKHCFLYAISILRYNYDEWNEWSNNDHLSAGSAIYLSFDTENRNKDGKLTTHGYSAVNISPLYTKVNTRNSGDRLTYSTNGVVGITENVLKGIYDHVEATIKEHQLQTKISTFMNKN